MTGCCSPSRGAGDPASLDGSSARRHGNPYDGLVALAGGRTLFGGDDPDHPEEWPVRGAEVAPYRIGRCAVSNAAFDEFVAATGHVTDAERFGWSFVFAGFLPDDFPPTRGVAAAPCQTNPLTNGGSPPARHTETNQPSTDISVSRIGARPTNG